MYAACCDDVAPKQGCRPQTSDQLKVRPDFLKSIRSIPTRTLHLFPPTFNKPAEGSARILVPLHGELDTRIAPILPMLKGMNLSGAISWPAHR